VLKTLGGTRAPRQRRLRCLYLQQRRRDPGRPTLDVRLRNRHPVPQPSTEGRVPASGAPWYADDADAGAKFDKIERFFRRLCEIGPLFGYYPEPTKSILIVRQHNLEEARLRLSAFRVKTGNRYLGGFIGEEEALNEWLGEKTKFWTEAVTDLTSVMQAFPQAAYSGLQNILQQEWQFVQRVTKGIGPEFAAVEQTLAKTFLPTLFGDEYDDNDPRRALAGLPVKWAGLAIPDPTTLAQPNYEASILLCSQSVDVFRSTDHLKVIRDVKAELKLRNAAKNESSLNGLASKMSYDNRRTILRGKETGQWLLVLPSTVNSTELSAQEFRDALLLRYTRCPPDLPIQCDGCQQKFSVRHALECKRGGLVISRHNKIRDELSDLASKAFFPSAVRDEPIIHTSRASEPRSSPGKPASPAVKRLFQNNRTEDRDDILVRGLWARGTDCIIDVRITDVDAKSQRSKDPLKVFKSPREGEEKEAPRGMPRATLALLSLRGIHGRFTWQGITNLAQETVRAPR
jgi:hypothetical protein